MTSSASEVSLGNRALLMIGARAQISSLNEASTEANAINVLFQPTFEQLARTAPWGCLRQQAELTLLAAAAGTPENVDGTTMPVPPVPWQYQYAVPSNSMQIRYIVPTFPNATLGTPITTASISAATWVPGLGQIPFAIAYATDINNNPIETVLCNQSQAQAVYTINQPNPIIWDSLFEQGFVASLAAYLVPALSLDLPLMDRAVKQAETAISLARVRDGNEGTTSQNRNAQWMDARVSGGSLAYLGVGAYGYGSWTDMAWPGG
jgi:hypothetical protein